MLSKVRPLFVLIGCLNFSFGLTPGFTPLASAQGQPFNLRVDQSGNRLAPGDKVRLTVVGFPDLSGEQIVLNDGTIQIPLAGDISLEGLSPSEAKDRIIGLIKPYVRRPQVSLALLNRRTPRISITGEVNRPGPRQLGKQPNTPQNESPAVPQENPTVSSSLLLAGGVTPNADLRNVIIRRANPNNVNPTVASSILPPSTASANPTETPQIPKKEIKVNLWNAIRAGNLSDDPQIYDGDEIVVPTATLTTADRQALLASTVAPDKISVQVSGQVQRPGTTALAPNSDVTAAIAAAGGPTDKANAEAVTLIRMAPDGKVERQTYAFGKPSGPLMNGDVILVEKSGTSTTVDFLSAIGGPLGLLFRGF